MRFSGCLCCQEATSIRLQGSYGPSGSSSALLISENRVDDTENLFYDAIVKSADTGGATQKQPVSTRTGETRRTEEVDALMKLFPHSQSQLGQRIA